MISKSIYYPKIIKLSICTLQKMEPAEHGVEAVFARLGLGGHHDDSRGKAKATVLNTNSQFYFVKPPFRTYMVVFQ